MILGIGTDLANIDRIAGILEKHGARFIARCFSEEERHKVETTASGSEALRSAGYAKRWAAKEACAKALGLGIRDNIFLKDIAVVNDAAGRPSLTLSGGAKERLTALTPRGMTSHISVSLSDEPPLALAFVVISANIIE
ncbi:MAG: holo-ACP synthase [Micavibrio sp.]|nr:holo-ACP synthase [Micavibrio sp.]